MNINLTRRQLLAFFLGPVLAHPVFIYYHYQWMQRQGAYPPEADSIGIPIFGGIFIWLFWAPILGSIFWSVLKDYSPPLNLLAWDTKRKFRSFAFTTLFTILAALAGMSIPGALEWNSTISLGSSIWWIFIWFFMRALVVGRRPRRESGSDRDRTDPRGPALPHHHSYGSVSGGSADSKQVSPKE